jgi:hypothetical protein
MDLYAEPETKLYEKGIVAIIADGVIVKGPDDIIAVMELMFSYE